MRTLCAILPGLLACGSVSIRDVREAEDRREAGSERLRRALDSEDAEVRSRAALAYGRIQHSDDLAPLVARLAKESDGSVRRSLLFAVGQMAFGEEFVESGASEDAVAAFLVDSDPGTRRAAVEALGKLGGARAAERIVTALHDPSSDVRGEAAVALFRLRFVPVWTGRRKDPPVLPSVAVNALVDAAADADENVRWRVAYSLARYGEPAAVSALKRLAADPNAWTRLFSVRALGRSGASGTADTLRLALRDPEASVRLEAVTAAERTKTWDLVTAEAAADPSFHVRAAIARALGTVEAGRVELLEKLSLDPSPTVRGDALASRVRRGDSAAGLKALADPHWRVRKAAAAAGGLDLAERAFRDFDRRVRSAAVEALGALRDPKSAALIRAALEETDLGLRLAAVSAISHREDLPRLDLLRSAYARSLRREDVEIREEIAGAASELPGSSSFLRELLRDPAPSVRSKARRALLKKGERAPIERVAHETSPFLDRAFASAPVVVLETDKGLVEIECLPTEAPIHVASFVELTRRGVYDGLLFHRVVSNFVIQGGDPRGDGSGDAGYHLRDEINRVPYDRGTVGMPKGGKDTGGCQIFITHTPTPHLDGNYTVFGRVVSGMDVVDRIEEGDRILRARVRD